MHYTGTLANGTKFDSSVDKGRPFTFTIGVGQVIKGWDEGVIQMSVGEKAILNITPDFGYGERGRCRRARTCTPLHPAHTRSAAARTAGNRAPAVSLLLLPVPTMRAPATIGHAPATASRTVLVLAAHPPLPPLARRFPFLVCVRRCWWCHPRQRRPHLRRRTHQYREYRHVI